MKVAIMQPYLFPYIGYWQLINAVDCFVILDDVNYIKKGWINRNIISLNGKPYLFTVPIKNASQNKFIYELEVIDSAKPLQKILKLFYHAYSRTPNFYRIYPIIKEILLNNNKKLNHYIGYSIKKINEYVGINTDILFSSNIKNNTLRGQEKIINICKVLGADCYVNPIGGFQLYDSNRFKDENIKLRFLKSEEKQNTNFTNNLSIIDVLMSFNLAEVQGLLSRYKIIPKDDF